MIKTVNQNNNRIKTILVLANENKCQLNPFVKKCETTHKATLIEFIYEIGIEIPNIDIYRISSQELAYYLIEQGFSVILQTEQNTQKELVIYLPETLGNNQRQYLNLVAPMVGNCNLSVFQIDTKEEVLDYCIDASKNIDSLIDFVRKVPSYKEESNMPKTLKRKS